MIFYLATTIGDKDATYSDRWLLLFKIAIASVFCVTFFSNARLSDVDPITMPRVAANAFVALAPLPIVALISAENDSWIVWLIYSLVALPIVMLLINALLDSVDS